MTLDEFEQMTLVSDLLPVTFMTGRQKYTGLQLSCSDCKIRIPDNRTRGTIEPIAADYRSVVTAYDAHVMGLCTQCNCLTHGHYVLRDDMTVVETNTKTGETFVWKMERTSPPTWRSRVRSFVVRLLGKKKRTTRE